MWEITKSRRDQRLVTSAYFEPRYRQATSDQAPLPATKLGAVLQLVTLFGERLAAMALADKPNLLEDCRYAEFEFEHFVSSADQDPKRHELWICFGASPMPDKDRCKVAIQLTLAPDFTPTAAVIRVPHDRHDIAGDPEITQLIANALRRRGKTIPAKAELWLPQGTSLVQEYAPAPFRPSNAEVAQLGTALQQIGYADPRARFWQAVGFSASLEQN